MRKSTTNTLENHSDNFPVVQQVNRINKHTQRPKANTQKLAAGWWDILFLFFDRLQHLYRYEMLRDVDISARKRTCPPTSTCFLFTALIWNLNCSSSALRAGLAPPSGSRRSFLVLANIRFVCQTHFERPDTREQSIVYAYLSIFMEASKSNVYGTVNAARISVANEI